MLKKHEPLKSKKYEPMLKTMVRNIYCTDKTIKKYGKEIDDFYTVPRELNNIKRMMIRILKNQKYIMARK